MKKILVILLLLLAIGAVGAFARTETQQQRREREEKERETGLRQQVICEFLDGLVTGGESQTRFSDGCTLP